MKSYGERKAATPAKPKKTRGAPAGVDGAAAAAGGDVLLPYTHCLPAALIVDCYAAHFTPAVLSAAASMQLQLIQVPAGCTADLQPL